MGVVLETKDGVVCVVVQGKPEINGQRGVVVLCSLRGSVKEIFDVNANHAIVTADSLESGLQKLHGHLKAAESPRSTHP